MSHGTPFLFHRPGKTSRECCGQVYSLLELENVLCYLHGPEERGLLVLWGWCCICGQDIEHPPAPRQACFIKRSVVFDCRKNDFYSFSVEPLL